jgi:aspartyl-tRNA(Asn)/glutamyl-tRNA(Gln) amidotransferase subunit B
VSIFDSYETVIGLEIHVQLNTATKLFSPARNRYGDAPNTNVDVVDAALPGVLPVLNGAVVQHALKLGLALDCQIAKTSVFARKHYFYPDSPKGYQISQFALPLCGPGVLPYRVREAGSKESVEKSVRITRIHIEEDAGKSVHVDGSASSFLDDNRVGTPLLEVVGEPDLRTPEQAEAYFRALRAIVVALGICDGNLQEGSMRADANVSVRKLGSDVLGQRTELKNLNSPRHLALAIAHEADRQIVELEGGRAIVQETRLWDAERGESRTMRSKEDAHDYRYFTDPDLPPLVLNDDEVENARRTLPELPAARAQRYVATLGLSYYDASVLTSEPSIARYFEDALASSTASSTSPGRAPNAKGIANWILNDVLRVVKDGKSGDDDATDLAHAPVVPADLAALVQLIDDGVITGKIAKDVFVELASGARDPMAIVDARGWRVQRDLTTLQQIVDDTLDANAGEVAKLLGGQDKLRGFFVGRILKATQGKADPKDVNALLDASLEKRRT